MINIVNITENEKYLSSCSVTLVREAERVFVQSERVACASYIRSLAPDAEFLDRFYDECGDYDCLVNTMAAYIAEYSKSNCVFLCLGGICENGIVAALAAGADVRMIPSVSTGDICLAGAAVKFSTEKVMRFPVSALPSVFLTGREGVLVTNIFSTYELSDVKIRFSELDENTDVCVCTDGEISFMNVNSIDRIECAGNETCVFMPAIDYEKRERNTFYDLVEIMERLRSRNGCPWDREQTHESIAVNVIEEAYEVADAIDRHDTEALYDELGDLLLQVVFHEKIARDSGEFDMFDILTAICKKLIRRHPHIYGNVSADTSDKVLSNWDDIKRGEKKQTSVSQSLMDVPAGMSALIRTQKIQKKAAHAGFDFDSAESAMERLRSEIAEFEAADGETSRLDEAGDIIFSVCNVIRLSGLNCENALMHANDKFIRRFREVEKLAGGDVSTLSRDRMDEYWEKAKNMK